MIMTWPPRVAAELVTCTFMSSQARLKIYPGSAYGFFFQHHSRFAADFLAAAG